MPKFSPFHIVLLLLAAVSPRICARETVADSVSVYFPQSRSTFMPDFRDNRQRIDSFISSLPEGAVIDRLTFTGAASPEGSVAINRHLSEARAHSLFSYLEKRYSLPDSIGSFIYLGRDWQGLYAAVLADSTLPHRDDLLRLLASEGAASPEGPVGGGDLLLSRLKSLDGGTAYADIYRRLFPSLRFSQLKVGYTLPPLRLMPPIETSPLSPGFAEDVTPFAYTPALSLATSSPRVSRPFYMALKTNLLYDALALPSLGAEFYLGKGFSAVVNWHYGWWDKDSRHRYWRAYGGDLALRWWFGRAAAEKPLTGHHIGLYGGVETFDFEFGGRGVMGGIPRHTLWDRCMALGGIEYGYSLPVGRRLNIDFTLGLGYMGGKYIKYVPVTGGYRWLSTHRLNWFGPTKLEISLVWLIGHGNFNLSK